MRLEWIEDILAVLDAGSLVGAAEQRFLTPSAFTRRIRAIEDALGCPLFDRSRKPVTLLPHVMALEPNLRQSMRRFRELRLALANSPDTQGQRLTLGCQHTLTTMVSPSLARPLSDDGKIALRIKSGTRSECQLMLLRQQVDFALVYETAQDALQFDPQLFEKLPLGQDSFVPVANVRDHAAMRRALEVRELPLITYPADIYLGEVLRVQVFPNLPRDLSVFGVAETGLATAVLQFIRQGLGIGWLPRSVADETIASGELTDLSNRFPSTLLNIRLIRSHTNETAIAQGAWTRLSEIENGGEV